MLPRSVSFKSILLVPHEASHGVILCHLLFVAGFTGCEVRTIVVTFGTKTMRPAITIWILNDLLPTVALTYTLTTTSCQNSISIG